MTSDRIRLTARNLDCTPEVRRYIRERVSAALARFAGKLTSVIVRVADINGPRGGVDKSCTITASISTGALVVIESRAETTEAAVATASRRVTRTVARQLDRARGRARAAWSSA